MQKSLKEFFILEAVLDLKETRDSTKNSVVCLCAGEIHNILESACGEWMTYDAFIYSYIRNIYQALVMC